MSTDKTVIQRQIDVLLKRIDEIQNVKVSELSREAQLGAVYGFQNELPLFITAQQMFIQLRTCDLASVPLNILNSLIDLAAQLVGHFKKISEFEPTGGNPSGVRMNLLNEFSNYYQALFANLTPIFAHEIRSEARVKVAQQRVDALLAEVSKSKDSFEQDKKKYTDDFASTLKTMKDAAGQVGVTRYATLFQAQSRRHFYYGMAWLVATLIVACGVVGASYMLFFAPISGSQAEVHQKKQETTAKPDSNAEPSTHGKAEPSTLDVIRAIAGKFVILSALFFVLTWCARNYGAHQHNEVINRHRQNALETFQAFVKAAGEDVQTKHAVLLETTHSIFSVQSSGYGQSKVDGVSSPKILELIRPITEKKE